VAIGVDIRKELRWKGGEEGKKNVREEGGIRAPGRRIKDEETRQEKLGSGRGEPIV